MLRVAGALAVAAVATAVVWVGGSKLEQSADDLATHYHLPPVVQGAVIAAVGSSFPELSSAVLATYLHGDFALGVGAIVGSAIFNILVIPAASALAADGPLDSNRDLVYKEAQFYMLSVAVLLLTFAFAVIYNPTTGLSGTITRPLALIPVALYGLYLFVQYQDTADHRAGTEAPTGSVAREWAVLAGSLAIILVGVEALVQAALTLGDALGTPAFLWGLTVVAAGTSLPDTVVSVRAARDDNSETSLANVLGSNVFDLLIAVPAGVLVAGSTVVDFEFAAPMMAVLVAATIVLFTVTRTDLELTDREAYTLLALYATFVVWLGLETLGVTNVIPT
ncbi:sodium:calcium antiporter [Halobacterium litoreum]|uniref:Sodium:calcium antiporter n=1 Tax=Halobacterium litoreum TaxID=2039234 RepID=A0ABD5NFR7_9EURY|nr:sodium:calcium antiporter [Halobacterium litoreum]UHH13192.1 sodium:calcium antiporter [Halobacterium litoreum]